ncbi:hypothetical protein [Paraburkholderia youngii]|uniref:hypothetical protein n=1 Tax=Paraburkholderia youngii TaxID=2782701 RepID=UPI003D19CBFE
METGATVIGRIANDIVCGRAFWVPRPIEREPNHAPPATTPEARRERDRLRRAAQRAKHTGRPT